MSCEILLKHMQGATSQAPISVDELVVKTGLLPDTIITLLDQMHNQVPAPINKVKITSAGKTSIVCWLTGQVQRYSYAQTNTAIHKPRIPRESENKIIAHRTLRRQPMKSSEKTVEIVKRVIECPGIRIDTLAETISGAKRGTAQYQTVYARINYALQQDILTKDGKALYLGTNETWLAQHNLIQALNNLKAFEQADSAKSVFQTIDIDKDKAATEVAINNGTQSQFSINTALLNAVDGATSANKAKNLALMLPSAQLQAQSEAGVVAKHDEDNIPAFLRNSTDTKTPAEPSKPLNHGQGVLFDGIMSLCSTLPDYSSITIKVDKQGDHEVLLELDDGDQLFRFNDDIFAVQKVIDAYNVLQQFKDAQ